MTISPRRSLIFWATPTASGKSDLATPAVWLSGFYAALAVDDDESLDRLAAISLDGLQGIAGVRPAPHALATVRCMQAVWTESASVGALLAEAIERADPAAMHPDQAAWALQLDLPALALLFHIQVGSLAEIESALTAALEAHRTYWSASDRAQNPDGIIALPVVAMLALARRAGLRVRASSPYLPPALLRPSP